ncbi:MAG TPA: carbon-nitrogen hydrolase family protein [Clostridia bacterium]|jgi:predicted amidohydrolase|nr:carbon-nitrogen hydrolase family protein [Clostridia bacterium]
MTRLKVALIQMRVVDKKEENLKKAAAMIGKAAEMGVELAVLPEMFNCPYQNDKFPLYAEKEGGPSWEKLAGLALEHRLFLVGGSVPELDEQGLVYNTSYVFDNQGRQIAKHRKMHLFDIAVEGGQSFQESAVLSAGNAVTVFDTPYGKMGVLICYDFRFPELSRLMVQRGAKLIIVPAAFNMTTGPLHWELLFRARAVDNQVYTLGAAPARDWSAHYVSYGNSIIVDPWGGIVSRLGEEEDLLVADLDLTVVEKVRRELPLLNHIRKDVYQLKEL